MDLSTSSSSLPETSTDRPTTGKIALAHLNEFPDYYQRLARMEEEARAYWLGEARLVASPKEALH